MPKPKQTFAPLPTELSYLQPFTDYITRLAAKDQLHEDIPVTKLFSVIKKRVKGMTDQDAAVLLVQHAKQLQDWLDAGKPDSDNHPAHWLVAFISHADSGMINLIRNPLPAPDWPVITIQHPQAWKQKTKDACILLSHGKIRAVFSAYKKPGMEHAFKQLREPNLPSPPDQGWTIIRITLPNLKGLRSVCHQTGPNGFVHFSVNYNLELLNCYIEILAQRTDFQPFDLAPLEACLPTLQVTMPS